MIPRILATIGLLLAFAAQAQSLTNAQLQTLKACINAVRACTTTPRPTRWTSRAPGCCRPR